MHQTAGNVLQSIVHTNPPQNMTQVRDKVDGTLATAMHAVHTTVAMTQGSSPRSLAFGLCARHVFEMRK